MSSTLFTERDVQPSMNGKAKATKKCKGPCAKVKPISEFQTSPAKKDKLSNACMDCELTAKKICQHCKKEKLLLEFGNHAFALDGKQPWCRDCQSVVGKKRATEPSPPSETPSPSGKYDFVKELKTCTKCKKTKGLEEFNKRSDNKTKRQSWCRSCQNASSKARQKTKNLQSQGYEVTRQSGGLTATKTAQKPVPTDWEKHYRRADPKPLTLIQRIGLALRILRGGLK